MVTKIFFLLNHGEDTDDHQTFDTPVSQYVKGKKKDIKRGGGAPYSHFCFEQQIVIADAGKLSAKQTIYLTYMYVDELCMRSVCGGAKAKQGCLSRL